MVKIGFSSLVLGLAVLAGPGISGDELSGLCNPRKGRSMRVTSTAKLRNGDPNPDSNSDNFRIPPGKTHVLADLKGPGIIRHIWITFLGPKPHPWAKKGAANHKEMLLRMFWDGREKPDVEAPVGDFFAAGFGKRMEVRSLPVQVENGAGYNCFWSMPFRKSARIEIVNDSKKQIALLYYNIDWQKVDNLPEDLLYFCAQYRQEYPVRKGKDYVLLEAEGRGHYVGTVLSVRTRSPSWFGEGDLKAFIDDDRKPSIWGTGTEDYFLCAWGLRECTFPYFGVPHADPYRSLGSRVCAYRWHIADPFVFQKRIRVTLEHYGWISPDENPEGKTHSWNEREDDYSSVAFWYQAGPTKRFTTTPPAASRLLPEIDIILHGRRFAEEKYHGAGKAVIQRGSSAYPLWTDHAQLLYQPPSPENAWLDIPFEIKKKEPCRLVLRLTTSYDFGIYRATLNGIPVGRTMDLYSRETEVRDFPLLDFWPAPGRYNMRLECVGKSVLSKGCWLGLDSVRLRERRPRVAEYGYDKDHDWRKKPKLY